LDESIRAVAQASTTFKTPTLQQFLSSAPSHQRTNISLLTAPSLLKLLKAYKSKAGSITIGVVGDQHVGKSSLINSLKRIKVFLFYKEQGIFFIMNNFFLLNLMFRYERLAIDPT
jgi:ribosome biogenesis GTPase A